MSQVSPLSLGNVVLQEISRYNLPMSRTAAEILEETRQLPPNEREWVAYGLLIDSAEEIEPKWAGEVERRVAQADAGNAATCSWQELESRLRSRLAQ